MNGAEHFQQAENLIKLAQDSTDPTQIEGGWEPTSDPAELETRRWLMERAEQEARDFIAVAQVHATLALAAATEANKPASPNAYRCIECGAMAATRVEHEPTCSIYVKPWAGTTPDDLSSLGGAS